MANREDPDKIPHSAESDLSILKCLLKPIHWNTYGKIPYFFITLAS